MPSIWLRAASSASRPSPARSCNRKENPDDEPSSGIGGGLSGKMKASRIWDSAPNARPATPWASLPGAVRSLQSLRVTNASAAFWP